MIVINDIDDDDVDDCEVDDDNVDVDDNEEQLQRSSNQRESRFSRILENYFEISLLDLGLEVFQFHFHFSKRVKEKIISLFISQKE